MAGMSTTLNPTLCRAARGLLDFTQSDLAVKVGASQEMVTKFENGVTTPRPDTLAAVEHALAASGCVFYPADPAAGLGPGVRLKWPPAVTCKPPKHKRRKKG